MKISLLNSSIRVSRIVVLVSLFLVSITFISCEMYYFNEPQPDDSKNIYRIPNKLRGSWDLNDDNSSILIVGKDYYKLITKSSTKMSKNKMDLDSIYYFIGNKVYAKDGEILEGGYVFEVQNDSIIIDEIEVEIVEFGQKAFIRKFDYGYILNIQHGKMNDWWHIRFIDIRDKEGFKICDIEEGDLSNDSNHKILHKEFTNYIIANWSKQDFKKFIDSGGFSETAYFLKFDEKIK